ncbi:MAG: B12-binding domain-containing radical SAM protein [Archangiaceae bacterium]|nr:B12-binding domain-containing radical SAM protein [Archangiaceae bacterium]
MSRLRLYLVNPFNPLVSILNVRENVWNQFRVWKPLSLLVIAGLTPDEWEVTIFDENLGVPDYAALPRPDLVGITAFTSQANRAYALSAEFRARGVPVVLGGIHVSMRTEEACARADSVVIGEAESVWHQVLTDARAGALEPTYLGSWEALGDRPPARHALLPTGYRFGSIQLSRGCPLACSFCSVSQFNGMRYRSRPVAQAIAELRQIPEKLVLVVDDNVIGTSRQHVAHAKELFRAMADAKLGKRWMGQATINVADDEELIELAARSGCFGLFIGFESPSREGLEEIGKKFNRVRDRDLRASVRRLQRHGIMVAGSFVLGLDVDTEGIGRRIAEAGDAYGVDLLNVLFMTPLPGTRLWDTLAAEGRIVANTFPEDWQYYTLTFPVAQHRHLSWSRMIDEMNDTTRVFYSYGRIARRALSSLWRTRGLFAPFVTVATNLSFKLNGQLDRRTWRGLDLDRGAPVVAVPQPEA